MNVKNTFLLAILGYIGVTAKALPSKIYNILRTNKTISISIKSSEWIIYQNLNNWLIELNKKCLKNNYQIKEKYKHGNMSIQKTINYGNYFFKIDTFTYCFINKNIIQNNRESQDILTVSIFGKHKEKYKNEILNKIKNKDVDIYTNVLIPGTFDEQILQIVKKDFNNVFCNKKDIVINHLEKWKSNKELYKKLGLTNKTGILLYGEPGTGKTTICRAIASYLKYDIKVFNFKNTDETSGIVDFLKNSSNCVILLEDIDCLFCNRAEEPDAAQKKMIGDVLNIIDGIYSPENVVFLATTNYINKLDPALIRAGRFDLRLEIEKIDYKEANEMCNAFGVSNDILKTLDMPINPSHLQNILLEKINIGEYKNELEKIKL